MNRFYFFFTLFVLLVLPNKALSHGAKIQYRQTSAIAIQAKYDDGQPMANAQVVIYAPSDRMTPWLKGTTDDSGNFTFVPDTNPENIGDWDIKVRQSGHGHITTIPIGKDSVAPPNSQTAIVSQGSEYTSTQKIVMAAAGVWGFIGTALFFSRSKSA